MYDVSRRQSRAREGEADGPGRRDVRGADVRLPDIADHRTEQGRARHRPPEGDAVLGVAGRGLTRVVRIIQDLLSSTRPRQPEPQWFPVEEVVGPSAILMEPAFHEKGIA